MEKFTTHTGVGVPLRRSDVDTDQIIPAEYLKRITRTGFEDGLFSAWRTNEPEFVLNLPRYKGASVLIARRNFGSGSSREHAVWALENYGFRSVIAPSFTDHGSTPIARAASSLSRTACNCAPKREWRSHDVTSIAATTKPSTSPM